jgi:hypothetical protein
MKFGAVVAEIGAHAVPVCNTCDFPCAASGLFLLFIQHSFQKKEPIDLSNCIRPTLLCWPAMLKRTVLVAKFNLGERRNA